MTGALIEFIFNLEPSEVASIPKEGGKTVTKTPRNKPIRERIAGQSLIATWAASGVVVAALVWGFLFFAPLTYGTPGLSVPEVQSRKWLNYDLHFAK